jgi:putative FmdB family regulatory protein
VPTYEYECKRCSRTFEARQRISEAPLTACPRCGGAVQRLIAPAPFILKGEGWHVTDYPSEGRKKALAEEKKGGEEKKGEPAPSATPSSATPSEPS